MHNKRTTSAAVGVPLLGNAPPAATPAVRRSMQGNRSRDTKPELLLRRALWAAGLRGYRLDYVRVPGRPDIAYVGRRVAVFVHGCFWHRCPHCNLTHPKTNPDYWERKFVRNRERDARKTRELEGAGWRVLVLWECEIKKNVNATVERLHRIFCDHAAEV